MKKNKPSKPQPKKKEDSSGSFGSVVIWPVVILIVTFLLYRSVTTFDSTNWDDKKYMKETEMVRGLTADHVKQMFTGKVLNSYNPIVLLTFAFDYKMTKLSPGWCHGVNLFIHLLNALLVFFCMRKLKFRDQFAGLIALLFAIHPLATEVVGWIACRKDVVYAFFFLLSWYFYLIFHASEKKLPLLLSFLFFTLSLLSKIQAITLPFFLIFSDLLLDKKFDPKKLINKIPYFLMTIVFGVIALSGSGELVADKYSLPYSFMDKILFSIMAFGLYSVKLIFPFNQTAMFQFPQSGSPDYMIYLVVGILSIVLLLSAVYFSLKKGAPGIAAGILIFMVAIFPVLHVVALNSALIYERFTYLASLGFFIALFALIERMSKRQSVAVYAVMGICFIYAITTYARIPVWKNSLTLWTDVIEKDPTTADAFTNRGQYFDSNGDVDKAFSDFSEAIRLQPTKPGGYNNRAVSYFQKKDFKNALLDNWQVLKIDSTHTDALVNRGSIYFNMDRYDSAIYYFEKALTITPRHAKSFYNLGAAYYKLGNYEKAIENYKKAVAIIPDYTDGYVFMAIAYARMNEYQKAESAVNMAEMTFNATSARRQTSVEYILMGNAAYQRNRADSALILYQESARLDPNNDEAYYDLGGIYLMKKDIKNARVNWQRALAINPNHVESRNWLTRTENAK